MASASDDLGAKLLKEHTGPGFRSEVKMRYSELARKTGAHKETVRLAVKRAERFQSIREWRILLNPLLIGQKLGALQVDARLDESEKSWAISQIKLIDGVVIISSYHGGTLRVAFYYDSEAAAGRKIQLIASICGVKKEDAALIRVALPFPGMLKKTDWMVLKAISKNPRRRSAEIAHELALSSRTVNRLIRKMTEARAIFSIAIVDVQSSHGLSVNYFVRCTEEAKGEIDKLVESQRLDFATRGENEYYTALLFFKNISEAKLFKDRLDKVRGAMEVRMFVLEDHIFVDSWLDEVVRKNAA